MNSKLANTHRADAAFKAGRFDAAERDYLNLLKVDARNTHAASRLGKLYLWKNKLTEAEHYLQQAQSNRGWFARLVPDPETHYNLALTHARAGSYSEASEELRKAAKPLAVGPLKQFSVLAGYFASFGREPPYQIRGARQSIIPVEIVDPLPVIQVSVNGSEAANFFIDTGGEGIFLDVDFANKVRAHKLCKVTGPAIDGKKTGYELGKVERVTLGELSLQNVPVSIADLQAIDETVFPDLSIKGIVGTGVLKQFLSTIDYVNKQLILRRTTGSPEQIDAVLALDEEDYVAPMWLVDSHLIFAIGSINDFGPELMFIDTGLAEAGVMLSKSVIRAAGIPSDWSKAEQGEGIGGTVEVLHVKVPLVTLGQVPNAISKRDVPCVVAAKSIPLFKGAMGFNVGGLISHAFFRDSALSFDFENMRIIVQHPRKQEQNSVSL